MPRVPTMAPATLLLTRPAEASARFLAAVEGLAGHPVAAVIAPLLTITMRALPPLKGPVGALVLTSEHGARAAAGLGLPPGLRAWCVGDRTAAVAAGAGLKPVSAGGDADALVAAILASDDAGPFVHVRGAHVRGDVARRLTAAGRPCDEVVAYVQEEAALTAAARALLAGPDPVILPLFSPRSVTVLAGQGPFAAPLDVVAISGAVAGAAASLAPRSLRISPTPDGPGMARVTAALLRGQPSA